MWSTCWQNPFKYNTANISKYDNIQVYTYIYIYIYIYILTAAKSYDSNVENCVLYPVKGFAGFSSPFFYHTHDFLWGDVWDVALKQEKKRNSQRLRPGFGQLHPTEVGGVLAA